MSADILICMLFFIALEYEVWCGERLSEKNAFHNAIYVLKLQTPTMEVLIFVIFDFLCNECNYCMFFL